MTEFIIYKRDGLLTNPKVVAEKIKQLPDGRYIAKIEKNNKRTNNQNAYYWFVVCDYVQKGLKDIGYREVKTKQDAHDVMKTLFLAKEVVNESTGEIIYVAGSTKTLSTIEFSEYLEEIYQWAAQYLNVVIPAPSTQTDLQFTHSNA